MLTDGQVALLMVSGSSCGMMAGKFVETVRAKRIFFRDKRFGLAILSLALALLLLRPMPLLPALFITIAVVVGQSRIYWWCCARLDSEE